MVEVAPIVEAVNVSVNRIFEDSQPQRVVEAVTTSVAEGEILAIVGPSGSGKSTLLRLFNRLLEPDSGDVKFAGQDIT